METTNSRRREVASEIHEAYESLADAPDRRLMPEGCEWRVESDCFCAWGEERGDDRD